MSCNTNITNDCDRNCDKRNYCDRSCNNKTRKLPGKQKNAQKDALTILQINADRSRAAHDLAYAVALKNGADMIIASEPNKKLISGGGWIGDQQSDVAILLLNRRLEIKGISKRKGFVILKTKQLNIIEV